MDINDFEINKLVDKFGSLEIQKQLAKLSGDYCEIPPDIDTFIEDPYYLGKSVGGNTIYPIWRNALRDIFPDPFYSPYSEIYLTGGIGLGKSLISKIIILYDATKILCLNNAQQFYSLTNSTVISFALMNATQALAEKVLYNEIEEMVEISPFFKTKLDQTRKPKTLFKNNIDITFGSRGSQFLGQAVISGLFSEINDMTVVGDQAVDLVDTISTRRKTRFTEKGRPVFGHLLFDSSNKGDMSFIEKRIEEKENNKEYDYKVFAFAHWEAKQHFGVYSGDTFRVYPGDNTKDPFIIDDNIQLFNQIKNSLDLSKIINVPVEHYADFRLNIIKSLRDLAGISTISSFNFCPSVELLNECIKHHNSVTKDIIALSFSNDDKLIDYIDIKTLMLFSRQPRYIHIDLAINGDSCGVACSYIDSYREVSKFDTDNGEIKISESPIYKNEWLMEIVALPGERIPIYKIKEFIFEIMRLGYPVKKVTTDMFQSENLRQDLELRKIPNGVISMDRTTTPYDYLRDCISERRLYLPQNEKLHTELKNLKRVKIKNHIKYDHPSTGSKDLSDAVCGSVYSCYTDFADHKSSMSIEHFSSALSTVINTTNANTLFMPNNIDIFDKSRLKQKDDF